MLRWVSAGEGVVVTQIPGGLLFKAREAVGVSVSTSLEHVPCTDEAARGFMRVLTPQPKTEVNVSMPNIGDRVTREQLEALSRSTSLTPTVAMANANEAPSVKKTPRRRVIKS